VGQILDLTGAKIVGLSDKDRAKECTSVIQSVCDRYNCRLIPIVTIEGATIAAGFKTVPLPTTQEQPNQGGS
jgi:hypothetical protein